MFYGPCARMETSTTARSGTAGKKQECPWPVMHCMLCQEASRGWSTAKKYNSDWLGKMFCFTCLAFLCFYVTDFLFIYLFFWLTNGLLNDCCKNLAPCFYTQELAFNTTVLMMNYFLLSQYHVERYWFAIWYYKTSSLGFKWGSSKSSVVVNVSVVPISGLLELRWKQARQWMSDQACLLHYSQMNSHFLSAFFH